MRVLNILTRVKLLFLVEVLWLNTGIRSRQSEPISNERSREFYVFPGWLWRSYFCFGSWALVYPWPCLGPAFRDGNRENFLSPHPTQASAPHTPCSPHQDRPGRRRDWRAFKVCNICEKSLIRRKAYIHTALISEPRDTETRFKFNGNLTVLKWPIFLRVHLKVSWPF